MISPSVEPHARAAETVLLVDDEDAVRSFVRRVLVRRGYTVLEAASAAEAERLAGERHPIDLLIADVSIPDADGREVAARLRVSRPKLRVLLVSGYLGEDVLGEAPPPPGTAFLGKPFGAAHLLDEVHRLLEWPDRSP